jgi:Protein of unknown function (DUF2939)
MRWKLWTAVVLVVLLAAYAIWPVVGFYRIASAIESRDAAALTQLVDFRSLRKSLTKQIVATYLELTGKKKKLGLIGKSIALGVGNSVAEPIVARLVNEETLLDLLTKGNAGKGVTVPAELAPFSTSALRNGGRTWWGSEYRWENFYVYLPPDKPTDEQFKVRLSLSQWQWKLSGLDLPEPLRVQLAKEVMKANPEATSKSKAPTSP